MIGFKILLDLLATSEEALRVKDFPMNFSARRSGESKLDRAIAFYERIGFHVMHRLEGEGSDTMGPATSRGAVMSLSDDPRASCKIELLKWTPSENEPPRERSPYQVGVSRIAIRTKNLLETVEELRSRGVEFLSEPHEIDVVGAKRYVLFRDPAGTLLELIEF